MLPIIQSLPNVTSFDTDPTVLVTVQEYFPLSSNVGDMILMWLQYISPPRYLSFVRSSASPFFVHLSLETIGDCFETLYLYSIVIASLFSTIFQTSKTGGSVIRLPHHASLQYDLFNTHNILKIKYC